MPDWLRSIGGVKPPSDELLYCLLWTLEALSRPSVRLLYDTFESCAWRNGLPRQIHRLCERNYLECAGEGMDQRVIRLTEKGRAEASGGLDPPKRWSRPWDGRWRIVVYDVPVRWNALRLRVCRALQRHRFGRVQKSVWITPDPASSLIDALRDDRATTRSLVCFDAQPATGERPEDLVRAAWNWAAINSRYRTCMRILDELPQAMEKDGSRLPATLLARERQAWTAALAMDPLLPEALLPAGYLGRDVWDRQQECLPALIRVVRESG